ncbi:MAG: hypothetical protein HYZ12_01855 [Thaumarchaeota archaeon]|nr:hypothetical protein [Nitrososphaerota archaeon]
MCRCEARLRFGRSGLGEVVSSLSMLAVTMALLGSFSFLSLQSIKSAVESIATNAGEAATEAGVLLRVVATQQNTTGSFVWVFNYGWESTKITSVYVDGDILQGWSSSCVPVHEKEMCVVRLPSSVQGDVTLVFGGKRIAVPI